jgi:hypothetical protein
VQTTLRGTALTQWGRTPRIRFSADTGSFLLVAELRPVRLPTGTPVPLDSESLRGRSMETAAPLLALPKSLVREAGTFFSSKQILMYTDKRVSVQSGRQTGYKAPN